MTDKKPDLRISIDNRVHELHMGSITPALAMEVRKATGMPLSTFLQSPTDPDSIGVLVWLARRLAGEIRLTLSKVLEEITIDKLTEGFEAMQAAEDAAPVATNGDSTSAAKDIQTNPESPGADS